MIPELGHYALVLAFGLAIVQGVVPFWGARCRDPVLMRVAEPTAFTQFALVAAAFVALAWSHVASDFSVLNVFENSHSAQPLIYKIAGVWGNHEGSLLLWLLLLLFFGVLVSALGFDLPATLRADALSVQAWIAAAFELLILSTANPFARLSDAPFEGRELNPMLQDPGLAIHPPLLYLGYVGTAVTFSFAIAALVEGTVDVVWARFVRPWVLIAWMFLTIGIAVGSYWAYYTLGWGSFWFWDPVENASLMPWLAGTALLHSAIVLEKRDALKVWTILLAIITFSLSLIGTFLERSGVLVSVQAFASDPARGVFILAIVTLLVGGGLALFAWRAPVLRDGGMFAPISREGTLVLNNLFLVTLCATVFVGTFYPLGLEALTGQRISVGEPFFRATFVPLAIPLLVSMSFGPLLPWKRGDLFGAVQRLAGALAIATIGIAASCAVERRGPVLAPFALGLALFVMTAAVGDLVERVGLFRSPFGTAVRRAGGLRPSAWGAMLAHFGIGLGLLGIVGDTQWGAERVTTMKPGQTLSARHYDLTFEGVWSQSGPNYQEVAGRFTVRRNGMPIGVMTPSQRVYPVHGTTTTQAALLTRGLSQLYLTLGEPDPSGATVVRLNHKPLVLLIWLGTFVAALGGALSLTDQRAHVTARTRARMPSGAQLAE
jgi:cytochrome c-type biogenesis protein CcmF